MATNSVVARRGVLALLLGLAGADAPAWDSEVGAGPTPNIGWSHAGESGPEHWGQLSPEFAVCSAGRLQSPVALGAAMAIPEPCRPLHFRYRSSALAITNDGEALRLGYDRGSYLVIDGLSYELVEVRFHVPAEHVIEGRAADGELQFIHGNNRGDLAIVAVPLIAGRRVNQILRRVLEHAPSQAGGRFYGNNIGINALFLMPGRKDYFVYQGSLTRPPCTEGVHWYVLREALEVEAADLRRLAQIVGSNARPIQPLNGRKVFRVCEP